MNNNEFLNELLFDLEDVSPDIQETSSHPNITQLQTTTICWFAQLIWLTAAASTIINPAAMPILTCWKSLNR